MDGVTLTGPMVFEKAFAVLGAVLCQSLKGRMLLFRTVTT